MFSKVQQIIRTYLSINVAQLLLFRYPKFDFYQRVGILFFEKRRTRVQFQNIVSLLSPINDYSFDRQDDLLIDLTMTSTNNFADI